MKGRNDKNRKKKVALISALLALFAILAGTFAWTSYTEWVKNHMQSRGYEEGRVTIVEEFPEDQLIDVDGTLTKKVNVANTSSADSFIRISFEEMLNKLANGAEGKGYESIADAKFPVIINDTEYRASGTYEDKTSDLVIYEDNTKTDTVTAPGTLKLYVTPDGKTAVLVNQRTITAAELPEDFDPEKTSAKMPIISGDWGTSVVVAQKVTGAVVKNTNGKFEVIAATGNEDTSLRYWGYGVDVGSIVQADWAGVNVNVTATVAHPATFGVSAIANSGITFTQADVTTTAPTVGNAPAADWFYNAADGYFYYTKVLPAGSTTSSSVLEEINFPDADTDETYKVASYNLYVGLESIPATQSALEAATNGGAFNGTPTVEGSKTWISNESGWGLTAGPLLEYFKSIATIVE